MSRAAEPSWTDDPISRRRAVGLAGGALLGTLLGGAASAQAASPARDLVVVTSNLGRAGTRGPYEQSVAAVRNGVKVGGRPFKPLVGFQEIGEGDRFPDFEAKLIDRYFGAGFTKVFNGAKSSASREPIVVPAPFQVISSNVTPTHGGIAKVSPDRSISEVVVQAADDPKLQIAILNTHYIAGAYVGPMIANRRPYWDKHFRTHARRIQAYLDLGLPVIWTGDVNRVALPKLHPNEQRVFPRGIDQIRWIPGRNGTRIVLEGKRSIRTTIEGNHRALVAHFRIRNVTP